MKKFHYLSFVLFAWVLIGCIDDTGPNNDVINGGVPIFNESVFSYSDVTASSVSVTAELTKENGSKINERGFCYSISPSPTVNDTKIEVGSGNGSYSYVIEHLNGNTVYYIRAYATNGYGTQYSVSDLVITTNAGLGKVETAKPSDIHAETAVVGGLIIDKGEGKIVARGVYYSKTKDFAVKDSVVSVEATDNYVCQLTNLEASKTYYYMAYVTNTYGTFFGKIDSLATPEGTPRLGFFEKVVIGYNDATFKANVAEKGDDDVFERGFCWDTEPEPDINGDNIKCGSGTGVFTGTISGLSSEQKYYVRAFARNKFGVVYSTNIDFYTKRDIPTVTTSDVDASTVYNGMIELKGTIESEGMSHVTAVGICWSIANTEPTLSDGVLTMPVGVVNTFSGILTNLVGGKTYYIRAYAINGEGTAYGEVKQFTVPPIFNTSLAKFTGTKPLPNSPTYFSVGDNLYVLGGDMGPNYADQLYVYSVYKDEWKQLASMPFSAKWQAGIGYGGGAFVYGGLGEDFKEKNSLHYYSLSTNLWNVYEPCPDSAYLTTVYAYSNGVYFIGGKKDTVKCDVWNFQIGSSWQKKTDFPVKQYGGIAVVIDGVAYAGMGKDDADVCNAKLWTTDDGCATWNLKTTCYILNGGILAGAVSNGRIYVIDESYYILEYNPTTDEWKQKSQIPDGYREIHCMYGLNNKIYIGLGTSNALISYDPMLDN